MRMISVIFLFGCVVSSPILSVSQALANACNNAGISISGGYLKETPPHAPVSAGYLTIHNFGKNDIWLTAIDAPFAKKAAVHEIKMSDGVMAMGEKEGGVRVPTGEMVTLAPGGLHLMFMGLKEPLTKGDEHIVTLSFSSCGTTDILLPVAAETMSEHRQDTHKHH